jgi:hypothetical protein
VAEDIITAPDNAATRRNLREQQMKNLSKGWKASSDRRGQRISKQHIDLQNELTDDEKNFIAGRRRQLRKKFKTEQLPLLESYLLIEVLQRRAVAKCFNSGTSYDVKDLDGITRLLLSMGESLQITPKEERKHKGQGEGELADMLRRAEEAKSKRGDWAREEEAAKLKRGKNPLGESTESA